MYNRTIFLKDAEEIHPSRQRPNIVTSLIGIIAISLAAHYCTAEYRRNPFNSHNVCEYRIRPGDTLTSILEGEGYSGRGLIDAVNYACDENSDRMMPGNGIPRPVFTDVPGRGQCDVAQVNGRIYMPDANDDGKVNGQDCGEQATGGESSAGLLRLF